MNEIQELQRLASPAPKPQSLAWDGHYAGVKFGKASVHLSKHGSGEYAKPIGGSIVYVFCDEVDGYYDEVGKKGAKVKYPPKDWPYGMREFMLADLDGNHLVFGCDAPKILANA